MSTYKAEFRARVSEIFRNVRKRERKKKEKKGRVKEKKEREKYSRAITHEKSDSVGVSEFFVAREE